MCPIEGPDDSGGRVELAERRAHWWVWVRAGTISDTAGLARFGGRQDARDSPPQPLAGAAVLDSGQAGVGENPRVGRHVHDVNEHEPAPWAQQAGGLLDRGLSSGTVRQVVDD